METLFDCDPGDESVDPRLNNDFNPERGLPTNRDICTESDSELVVGSLICTWEWEA